MSRFDDLIHSLADQDPETRRKAALGLGRLRDPRAIPALVDLYESDPDLSVREAAGRALRVFRRMEWEIKSGGDVGRQTSERRPGISTSDVIASVTVSLIGLVIIVGGLAFLLSRHMAAPSDGVWPEPTSTSGVPPTPTVTPTPTLAPDQLALLHIRAMRETVAVAEQGAAQILDIWTRVANEERPCEIPCCIDVPQIYRIPEAEARRLPTGLRLLDEVRNLNTALRRLQEAIDTWKAECDIERSQDAIVPPAVATTGLGMAEEAAEMLRDVGQMLALMEAAVSAGGLPPTRTPTPSPTTEEP